MFTIVDAAIYLQKNEIGRVVATQVLLVAFVIHKNVAVGLHLSS